MSRARGDLSAAKRQNLFDQADLFSARQAVCLPHGAAKRLQAQQVYSRSACLPHRTTHRLLRSARHPFSVQATSNTLFILCYM